VIPCLPAFLEQHPGLKIELLISDRAGCREVNSNESLDRSDRAARERHCQDKVEQLRSEVARGHRGPPLQRYLVTVGSGEAKDDESEKVNHAFHRWFRIP
jgi:hypothetical protein